jgi:gag-polyprotein putative aspartyl protease
MFDQSHGDTKIKYVGIDVEINKKKVRFMIDTGATINLIRKTSITSLGTVSCAPRITSEFLPILSFLQVPYEHM